MAMVLQRPFSLFEVFTRQKILMDNVSANKIRSACKKRTFRFKVFNLISTTGDFCSKTFQPFTLGLKNPTSVAVDWIEKELYWIDFKQRTIGKAQVNGSNQRTLFTGTKTSTPHRLIVIPCKR